VGQIAGLINYFTKAIEAYPREAQYWINLIKLLIVVQEYEAAEDWLERFQGANTYSGTERDFIKMRRAIDEARSGRIRAATTNATNTTR
jgi:tetratricopeptide (TPR) repeat protein